MYFIICWTLIITSPQITGEHLLYMRPSYYTGEYRRLMPQCMGRVSVISECTH